MAHEDGTRSGSETPSTPEQRPPPGSGRNRLDEFISLYWLDRDQGLVRSLGDYLSRFPDAAEAVIREYIASEASDHAAPASRVIADGRTGYGEAQRLGPYRLIEELGRGGQGVVWLAEESRLQRKVALKVLRDVSPGNFEELLQRFQREALVLSQIDHPGLCGVYTSGILEGTPYIAMRHIEGTTLQKMIASARLAQTGDEPSIIDLARIETRTEKEGQEGGKPGTEAPSGPTTRNEVMRVVRLLENTSRSLHFAHEAGIVHRDIKPSNIMVTKDGETVILDFGLARGENLDADSLTRTGDFLGTPRYMAPEQFSAQRIRLDRRADIFSLGVTLFECLTLRHPFDAPTAQSLYKNIQYEPPPDPRRLNPAIPRDLKIVLDIALEKNPDRRYKTALDFAEDLRRVREFEPIAARPVGLHVRFVRWVQRNPALSAAVLSTFLALAAGLAVAWVQRQGAIEERNRADEERNRADALAGQLQIEADAVLVPEESFLWPATEDRVPVIEAWLRRAAEAHNRHRANRQAFESERNFLRADATMLPDGSLAFPATSVAEELRYRIVSTALETGQRIEALIPIIEARRASAASLRSRTIDDFREEWDETLEALAHDERYRRNGRPPLTKPIAGLVPLGRDPKSELFEFAETFSGEPPRRRPETSVKIGNASGMVFVLLPPGELKMGSKLGDISEKHLEYGSDVIDIASFLISKFEMTQGQWERVTGKNPSAYAPGRTPFGETAGGHQIERRNPVENVSWDEANEVLRRLEMSLPTEAQWEFACRAGSNSLWITGSRVEDLRIPGIVANILDAGSAQHWGYSEQAGEPGFDDGHAVHAPVGSFAPNDFGLHDVHGNVAEICLDSLIGYPQAAPRPGDGLRSTDTLRRAVFRGGSYRALAIFARSGYRDGIERSKPQDTIGIRPVRRLEE